MYLHVKSIDERTKEIKNQIARYEMLRLIVPPLQAELEKWKTKKFNIKTAQALANAAAAAIVDANLDTTRHSAYASKYSDYNDSTIYRVSIHFPIADDRHDVITLENAYSNGAPVYETFVRNLERFTTTPEDIAKYTQALAALPARHARAEALVKEINELSDIVN